MSKALIEVDTDLRYAPKHLDTRGKLSWLARFAQMGIKLGTETLRQQGNVCCIVSRGGEFKIIRDVEEFKKLLQGGDNTDGQEGR